MLLLKEGPERAPIAAQSIIVPAGESRAITVKRGQILRIEAKEDQAIASMFAFSAHDPDVYMSVHHTRVFSNSYVLQAGMRIVSNKRRALMVLGKVAVVGTICFCRHPPRPILLKTGMPDKPVVSNPYKPRWTH